MIDVADSTNGAATPSSTSEPTKHYDVVIVGAGIVGPTLAVALAKQHRRVALIERDLREPNRIVGELMQPSGIHSLEKLGLAHCVEGIDAITEIGYQVFYGSNSVNLPYPDRDTPSDEKKSPAAGLSAESSATSSSVQSETVAESRSKKTTQNGALPADNAIVSEIIKTREFGKSFHHGRFISSLRKAAIACAPYVDVIEATVTDIINEQENLEPEEVLEKKRSSRTLNRVVGVKIKGSDGARSNIFGSITVIADGTTSKFRKEYTNRTPIVKSHFVGVILEDADMPVPNHGHVILGTNHAPLLVYQIGEHETRALFDIQGPMPSASNGDLAKHLLTKVVPNIPKQLIPSITKAIEKGNFRSMPNQFLPTSPQRTPGLIMLGDAWNMRHPLTGGGMTVALNDVVLVSEVLSTIPDFSDWQLVQSKLASDFYWKRKNLGSVVNILAQALYSLFAADSTELRILQRGCFKYFLLGGSCVTGPISLLSGVLPKPLVLIHHFFAVAFYAVYCNFVDAGIVGFPLAFIQAFTTIYAACVVILPYMTEELKWY